MKHNTLEWHRKQLSCCIRRDMPSGIIRHTDAIRAIQEKLKRSLKGAQGRRSL